MFDLVMGLCLGFEVYSGIIGICIDLIVAEANICMLLIISRQQLRR